MENPVIKKKMSPKKHNLPSRTSKNPKIRLHRRTKCRDGGIFPKQRSLSISMDNDTWNQKMMIFGVGQRKKPK